LIELRDNGGAVLLVSAELEEVTAFSGSSAGDKRRENCREVDPKTTSAEEIGLMMTGG
jgi:simple sugar transport system ATP-binding protein